MRGRCDAEPVHRVHGEPERVRGCALRVHAERTVHRPVHDERMQSAQAHQHRPSTRFISGTRSSRFTSQSLREGTVQRNDACVGSVLAACALVQRVCGGGGINAQLRHEQHTQLRREAVADKASRMLL